jgi:hypothetical protein
MKTLNKLDYGLFNKGEHWTYYFKDIGALVSRFFYLIKHGYTPAAVYEHAFWFIDVTKDALNELIKNKVGAPCFNKEFSDEENEKEWNEILHSLVSLLEDMTEKDEDYEDLFDKEPEKGEWLARFKEIEKRKDQAKEEFFQLYREYFWDLWD